MWSIRAIWRMTLHGHGWWSDGMGMNGQPNKEPKPATTRQERLAELSKLIAADKYNIPTEWVAESILRWRGRAGRVN